MTRKKIFIGGVNSDDADFLIDTKQFIGGLNIRFSTSREGEFGKVQNIEGTREITQTTDIYGDPTTWSLPAGTNTTIGALEDPVSQRVFFFNKNSNSDHAIYVYDLRTGYIYTVLKDEDTSAGLNFDNHIHSIDVYGNLLYWTDNVEWQRRINYEAGIKTYHPTYVTNEDAYELPIENSVLTLIRNPPAFAPTVAKDSDTDYDNNFTSNAAFQFQYRFIYRDGEESVLGILSELVNYNTPDEDTDGMNNVIVTMPYDQYICQDVLKVELAVKFYPVGNAYIIKTWDRNNEDDALEIDDHNTTTANLEYAFYNDIIGTALSQSYYTKQFDSIPRMSESLQVGKNKLFLANNTDGYDTPSSTSMSLTENISSDDTLIGHWQIFVYWSNIGHTAQANAFLIKLDEVDVGAGNDGWYVYQSDVTPTLPITDADFVTDLTFVGDTTEEAWTYVEGLITSYGRVHTGNYGQTSNITSPPPLAGNVGSTIFKSNAAIRAGIVFFDEAGRKCGVVTKESLKLVTTERTHDDPAFTSGIQWDLLNTSAITEIPDWAAYYAPVIQKCLRTRSFIQTRVNALTYIKLDADGAYETDGTYSENHIGLGIDISILVGYGLGYSYQAGDICKFYSSDDTNIYTLNVKDTFGKYLIVDLIDLGALPGTIAGLIEVYSPYFPSTSEPFYEVGQMFEVTDKYTVDRQYSVINGTFKGDTTVIERVISSTTYQVEAMSPNDLFWKNWNTNHGRPNFINPFGEVEKKVSLYWSNQSIPGTKVNGLSTFDALDQTNLPSEMVAIRKIILVDKIEAQGNIMLAIGEKETASIYLGETHIVDNGGNSFLATTAGTIGTINVLKGGYGTVNPESVYSNNQRIGWFDAIRGCTVKYDSNGLFATSNYKMFKFFKKYGEYVMVTESTPQRVYGGYDPFHDEVLFSMPVISRAPSNTILDDIEITSYSYMTALDVVTMPDIIDGRVYKLTLPPYTTGNYQNSELPDNVFVAHGGGQLLQLSQSFLLATPVTVTEIMRSYYEPFDSQGGIEVFNQANDMWVGKRSFFPQWMSSAGNSLVSFYEGKLFVHDDTDNYNTFYGQQFDSVIAGIHNDDGNSIKIYRAVSIEGDKFDHMHFRTEKPNVQSTDLYANEFTTREGVHKAGLKRDRLSPNDEGSYDEKLFTGDEMRGEVLKFQGVFSQPSTLKSFKFVNIKFDPSLSHTE